MVGNPKVICPGSGLVLGSLSVVSEARRGKAPARARCVRALSIEDREERGGRVGKGTPFRGKAQRYGAGRNASSNWRESLHAAALATGGERSWISAAVSLSTIIIGPPHLGQDQRSLGPEVETSWSVGGAALSSWKQSGKVVARLRLARKPKFRMRTKPSGSRCNRKRRKNSSSDRGSNFCSLL